HAAVLDEEAGRAVLELDGAIAFLAAVDADFIRSSRVSRLGRDRDATHDSHAESGSPTNSNSRGPGAQTDLELMMSVLPAAWVSPGTQEKKIEVQPRFEAQISAYLLSALKKPQASSDTETREILDDPQPCPCSTVRRMLPRLTSVAFRGRFRPSRARPTGRCVSGGGSLGSASPPPGITGTIPRLGVGIRVGQSAEVLRSFTDEDVATFGRLVGDLNPVHFPDGGDEKRKRPVAESAVREAGPRRRRGEGQGGRRGGQGGVVVADGRGRDMHVPHDGHPGEGEGRRGGRLVSGRRGDLRLGGSAGVAARCDSRTGMLNAIEIMRGRKRGIAAVYFSEE
ncbi:hypothetical protein THAOC_18815, partial [Thalassiosira oceanica]